MRYCLGVICTLPFIHLASADPVADLAAINARLAEVAPLRSQRITDHAPTLPDGAWAEAASAESATGVLSVAGHSARVGWGVAVMDVPIDALWAGLNDELWHRELLGLGHVELVKGSPCQDRRHVMMLLPLPVVSDRWWVVENRYNTALPGQTDGRVRELIWTGQTDPHAAALSDEAREKVAGAVPVTFNHGAWLLIDLDGQRTLTEYFSWSDPGGELPAGPATTFAGATIAKTLKAMETYAASGRSTCR